MFSVAKPVAVVRPFTVRRVTSDFRITTASDFSVGRMPRGPHLADEVVLPAPLLAGAAVPAADLSLVVLGAASLVEPAANGRSWVIRRATGRGSCVSLHGPGAELEGGVKTSLGQAQIKSGKLF